VRELELQFAVVIGYIPVGAIARVEAKIRGPGSPRC